MGKEHIRKENIKKWTDKLGSFMFYIILIVIFVTAFSITSGGDFSFLGYRVFDVATGSMEPAYAPGDLLIVKKISPEDINIGDAITFRTSVDEDIFLTHRVVEITKDGSVGFVTKGDNNNAADYFVVPGDAVVGKVIADVKKMGIVLRFLRFTAEKWYIFFPAVLVLAYCVEEITLYIKFDDDTEQK